MTVAEQISAEEALAHKLAQYAGRWVAVRDHDIVADADSLEELEALLEQLEENETAVEIFQAAADSSACFY
jgi:hypothetical protein